MLLSLWYDHTLDRFRSAGEYGIALEQARVAQGDIITASGVSNSIALTEGGGVWTGGGEGETQLVLVPPATFDGSQVVYSYRCTKRLHALPGKAESSNEKIQLSAAVNSQQTPAETVYSQICSSGSWSAFVTVVVIKVEF